MFRKPKPHISSPTVQHVEEAPPKVEHVATSRGSGPRLSLVKITFPSEYPLPASQVADLKVVEVSNVPSEFPLPDSQVADLKVISGTVTGTVSAEQSDASKLKATVTQSEKDRTITDISKVATGYIINLTATGIIRTPATGKKIRLKAFTWSSNADIVTALRFGTNGDLLFAIQAKGVIGMNLVGCNIEGAVNEALYGYLSGTGTIKGTVLIEEI